MQKRLIATTLVVVGAFGTGYIAGQIGGATPGLAAAKQKSTTTTKKKNVGIKATKRQSTTSTARHADGQITAVTGDTITVKPDADKAGSTEYTGVTTITLSSTTQYNSGHGSAPTSTRPAIAVGQYIVAEGTPSSDGKTLAASLVSVGDKGHGGGGHASGPHADGTISKVNGNVLTVTPDADKAGTNEYTGVTTINLTSTTQYSAGRGNAPTTTRPAIAVGQFIVAEGQVSTDGKTLTATRVSVRASGPSGH